MSSMRKTAMAILVTLLIIASGCLGTNEKEKDQTSSNPVSSTATPIHTPPIEPPPAGPGDYELLIEEYPSLREVIGKAFNASLEFPDVHYPIEVFSSIAGKRRLTRAELEILNLTLRANLCYFSKSEPPGTDYHVVSFSRERPLESIPYVECQNFTSTLPFVYYRGRGFQYYPVTASNWAYHYLKTGQVERAEALLKEMLPLMEVVNQSTGEAGIFNVYFEPPGTREIRLPWVSSFSQGMLAGLYAWLYNETGNETYLRAAHRLFNSFYLSPEHGGFVENTDYGIWFLEYPYRPDFLVLNGHIITMKGLWLYHRFTGDERALELFNAGVESVKRALPDCDSGEWSLYSVKGPEAREDYHRLHIKLLVWLYTRTGDRTFMDYAERWNGYLEERGLKKENLEALIQQVRKAP
ncbi:D-glucuronyl C5-epimerase family protein [Thermococcus aciditolerans]|uniref:D-glucuronyl C5-epimerase n=1 Tax=Thermococcus aciditolerans TaxID=2598455 RepID=A0A5C0SQA2_9EURY|nr:D-glucuronyl C5-epimerase family protein [Thermococcus aciditolerans]QEK15368.1 D-glucuronyl C5-epimerase [Thermococcus aciditolerans]